jgi:hypothetical protein
MRNIPAFLKREEPIPSVVRLCRVGAVGVSGQVAGLQGIL